MNPYFIQALYALYPEIVTTKDNIAYDADGNVVEYNNVAVQEEADKMDCKAQARQILYDTDWTTIPDVANPENNPYLMNQAEFIAYRNIVRGYAVNPVADPVFPDAPTEQWSS